MIAYLRGQLIDKTPSAVIVDVQGVGYQVEVPLSTFEVLPALNESCQLHIDMIVREDAMLLFGFASLVEKDLFRLLLKVNGIGPKLALAVLSTLSVDAFVQAVKDNQISALLSIPGVGKKTGERILLEMSSLIDRLGVVVQVAGATAINEQQQPVNMPRQQVIQALEGLGYKTAEAEKRVDKSWQEQASLSDNIKAALQVKI